MSQPEIIAGLDIGSDTIRMAVGEISPTEDRVNIIGLAQGPSAGVAKGTVRSIEEVVDAISNVRARAEKMTGFAIDHAVISISGSHITAQESKGVIAVARADGEIHDDDVERVLEAAQAVSVPPNYEILHVLPRRFSIDNQTDIKDPIGMNGVRLEVEAQIIEGQSTHIKNVTKAVNLAGLDIDDLVLASLASSESCLIERQKDLGVVLVNIGAATTSVLVFEEGDIILVDVMPVGSSHITNDIAIGLRTNIDIAEEIKIQYGSTKDTASSSSDEVEMRQINEQEEGNFSRKYLSEIIEARVEEIFNMVDKGLRQISRSGKLPAGVVLTGSGSILPGISEVAKREFRLPASVGFPSGVDSAIEKINNPGVTTAIGLVLWGHANHVSGGGFGSSITGFNGMRIVSEQFKSIIRRFKP